MTQEREIKLPPLPESLQVEGLYGLCPMHKAECAVRDIEEYARAAVALNAPAWQRTKDDPPPDTSEEVVIFDPRDGDKYILEARLVRSDPVGSPYWTSLPPLLPMLVGREES